MSALLCLFSVLHVAHCQVRVTGVVYAWLDSHATLECQADTTEEVKQITWEKHVRGTSRTVLTYRSDTGPIYQMPYGGRVIFKGDGYKNGSIQILNVTLADEGIFKCVFTTFPSGTIEGNIQLQVFVLPTIRQELMHDVRTTCTINMVAECLALWAKPAAEIQWNIHEINYTSKEVDPVTHPNGTTSKRSQLYIMSTPQLYGHEIRCLVYQPTIPLEYQKNITASIALTNIQFPPQMVHIEVLKTDKEAPQLLCKCNANPRPTYTWKRKSTEGSEIIVLDKNEVTSATLNLTDAQVDGIYICEVANDVGVNQAYIYMSSKSSSRWSGGYIYIILFVIALGFLCAAFYFKDRLWNRKKNTEGNSEDKPEWELSGETSKICNDEPEDTEEQRMNENGN